MQDTAVIDNIPREEAVRLIRSYCTKSLEPEYVKLEDACGRVAAKDICSRINLPDTPCSRWDGISFSYDDYSSRNGDVRGWEENEQYRFTNTGIPIFNDRFDTMVKIEDTVFEDGKLVSIKQKNPVERFQNVIPIGERMSIGEVLVRKDTLIQPSHLNLMASGNNLVVPVYRKPIVALIPSGDELVACADTPVCGQTIESNTYSMRAKVEQWGGRPVVYPIVKDNTSSLQKTLKEAAEFADLIVIGGGSCRGRYDLLQASISEIGTLFFSSVEHGPGHRTCFSLIDAVPVIGVVGPPGGEEMTFDFYVVPGIRAFLAQQHKETMVEVIVDEDIPPHPKVNFYFTMKLYRDESGVLHGKPLPHALLDRNIAEHNGYLRVPKTGDGYRKGDKVEVEIRIGLENI